MLNIVKDWGALVTVVLAAVAGLLWVGELRGDVKHLTDDVATLKQEMTDLKKPASAKGDMCRTMTDRISDALDEGRQLEGEQLAAQMNKMDCYGIDRKRFDNPPQNSP